MIPLVTAFWLAAIANFEAAYERCYYGSVASETCEDAVGRLAKRLEDNGFCVYGHGTVGRTGRLWTQKEWERVAGADAGPVPKGERHCYVLRR